jgi:superfamily I DNA/RNA helicase
MIVGMAPAQRHLYLTHAAERTRHGAPAKTTPSRFLSDVDATVCERTGGPSPGRKPRDVQLRLL